MLLKLASKILCHFVSTLQRYDTLSAHVPNVYCNLLQKKLQYTDVTFISVCNLRNIVSVSLCLVPF